MSYFGNSHIISKFFIIIIIFVTVICDQLFFLCFTYFILFIYFWLCWVFIAVCGLSSSCGERGLLFVAVHGLLIAATSLVAEHRL